MKRIVYITVLLCIVTFSYAQRASDAVPSAETVAISVYPNPFVDYLTLESNVEVSEVKVVDILGRQVQKFKPFKKEKMNLTSLPRGLYLIQVYDNRQELIATRKVKKS